LVQSLACSGLSLVWSNVCTRLVCVRVCAATKMRNIPKRCVIVDTRVLLLRFAASNQLIQCFAGFLANKHNTRPGHLRRCNPCHTSTRDVEIRATTLHAPHVLLSMCRCSPTTQRALPLIWRCRRPLIWRWPTMQIAFAHSDGKISSRCALRLPRHAHPPAPRKDRCKTHQFAQMEINLGSGGQSEPPLAPATPRVLMSNMRFPFAVLTEGPDGKGVSVRGVGDPAAPVKNTRDAFLRKIARGELLRHEKPHSPLHRLHLIVR